LAAALAAATREAAAVGLTAVVEAAALLAVVEAGLVVAELLDLLNPVLDLVAVEATLGTAGALVAPAAGLLVASLLVVAVVVLATAGLGLALDVELALDGCLDTVGVGLALVAGGRGAAEEVGRFGGSDLVSAVLLSVGLGLDGMVLGTVDLGAGLAGPFSVGFVAKGFLSATLVVCVEGFVGRLVASDTFSPGLVPRLAAPTVEEVGLEPADLGAEEVAGLVGPVLADAPVEEVGLEPAALEAVAVGFAAPTLALAPTAGFGVVLLTWDGPALLVDGVLPLVLVGLDLAEPGAVLAPVVGPLGVAVFDLVEFSGVGGSTAILGFSGVGSVVVILGTVTASDLTSGSGSADFSFSSNTSDSMVSSFLSGAVNAFSGVLALVGVAGVI